MLVQVFSENGYEYPHYTCIEYLLSVGLVLSSGNKSMISSKWKKIMFYKYDDVEIYKVPRADKKYLTGYNRVGVSWIVLLWTVCQVCEDEEYITTKVHNLKTKYLHRKENGTSGKVQVLLCCYCENTKK
jgi:hypothetical protein